MSIQEFFAKHKKGSFHSQLGVPKGQVIPIDLLQKIMSAHLGETIYNANHITQAKTYIKVTPLLQKKARFLINMRKSREGSALQSHITSNNEHVGVSYL